VVITEDFLNSEIEDLKRESEKARVFLIQADATIRAYQVMIAKLQEQPKEEAPKALATPKKARRR
jgi:hypothetical protein